MLTDAIIRNAKPKVNTYSLADIPGLTLNITPNGTKSFKFRVMKNGKRHNLTLGQYPAISLKEARQLAEDKRFLYKTNLMAASATGQHQNDTATTTTFAEFAAHWQTWKFNKLYGNDHQHIINKRQSTASQITRALTNDINPVIGHLPLAHITKQHTLRIQQNIETRGALSIAEKIRTWLNELFRLAIAEGMIEANPAADLDMLAQAHRRTKHNPYLKLHELPELLSAMDKYKGQPQTLLGLKLLLLTGVRTGELRLAKPEHFDLDNGIWSVPPENLKQIKKLIRNEKQQHEIPPYIVPLSTQAQQIIKKLLQYRYPNQPYLLCHRLYPNIMISENTLNQALKRMGYKNRLTGHGIRATLSTALHEMDYQHKWIEAQLSHTDKEQDNVSTTYNHAMYVEQRRQMMQDWADMLDRIHPTQL
ncbi:tyrosine-type recombinase/integrase [Orbaceae bacterium ac157xtp]